MRMTRRILATLAAATAVGVLAVTAAAATPLRPASGSATITIIPLSVRQADSNTILDGTAIGVYTGTIDATATTTFHWVLQPDGEFEFRDAGVLTGTVGSCGPVTTPVQGEVSGTLAAYSGHLNTLDAAAASAAVHIDITFAGGGFTVPYTGSYRC